MPGLIAMAPITPALRGAQCGADIVPSTAHTSLEPSFVCLFDISALVKMTYKLEVFLC